MRKSRCAASIPWSSPRGWTTQHEWEDDVADNGRAAHPAPQPISLREVMSQFATGITVITAGGEHAHGMTANAFTSVSLEPPLVLCCVARTARIHESILRARTFAVSVLDATQMNLARYFADRNRPRGPA